eukprot:6455820-Amphidinium_carterae.1
MIWAQLGPEVAIERWTQWLIIKFRSHGDQLHAAKRLYDAATWKVALLMRNKRSFQEATEEVMSDLVFVNEQLTAPSPASSASRPFEREQQAGFPQQPQQQRRAKGTSASKGKGSGKGGKTETCRGYNNGTCKM